MFYKVGSAVVIGVIGIATAAAVFRPQPEAAYEPDRFSIVQRYSHNPKSFTQGLAIAGGKLWEGSGRYGESAVWRSDLKTLAEEKRVPLGQRFFGEGLTVMNGRVYQLTWKSGICFVYDADSLEVIKWFKYAGEGWGIANDGKQLFLSDGTSTIRVRDPESFKFQRKLIVKWQGDTVKGINELEFVEGELWANIWYSDLIARIDPDTGQVLGWVDASGLWPAAERPSREYVLNGIAYDAENKRIFLTGKYWPQLFEVEVVKNPSARN